MLRALRGRIRIRTARREAWKQAEADVRKTRARFNLRFQEVERACREIDGATPKGLAARYMSGVMRAGYGPEWWRENGPFLTEAWFIYEYACENGLMERLQTENSALEMYVLSPESVRHDGHVILRLERTPGQPVQGELSVTCAQADRDYFRFVRRLGFQRGELGCVRHIGETEAPIADRAAEVGASLLKEGYSVCVTEPALQQLILDEDYVPEHRHWIMEGQRLDTIELRYPWDRQLHAYVCRAGGRWNGKTVEMSICDSHKLDDLIRLYGFRITDGAQKRMDAWREALKRATVYRSRKHREQDAGTPVDQFELLMRRQVSVIDDLYDDE